MGVFLKQAFSLLAGKMAGSNQKANFIVKTLRTGYVLSVTGVGVLWYSAYRNERVAPGTISFPFPGLKKYRREYPADRPEHELPHEEVGSPSGTGGRLKGSQQTEPLVGPPALGKGIAKANTLSGKYPYVWGGGHAQVGHPTAGGYDCSGTVCAVLAACGLIRISMTSGELANWGAPGPGKFITIYANEAHTFMKINVNGTWRWFGTGSDKEALRGGPAWGNHDPELPAYSVRHPPGF